MAAWFGVAIVLVALFTVLLSFAFYIYQKKKRGIQFQIATDLKESELHQKQTVRLSISPVLKPLFGFIKLRLLYDHDQFSEKFSLLENGNIQFFKTSIEGTYYWLLPQIKEYQVEKAILYFEDIFQFFSIAADLPANNRFFTHPTAKNLQDLAVSPRKTEDTSTRIDQLRKVEGEYLNYKNFENNDDVRRIVWKIYAKNKELVVRIPEIMDPYASHIYLFASYYDSFEAAGIGAIEVPFLNYYKVVNWSVYNALVKRGYEVRYIPDQEVATGGGNDEHERVKYSISTSQWHADKDLKTFVKTNDASVVVVSSLSNAGDVQDLLDNNSKEITFIFVKLTDSFKNQNVIDWVQWLFVENEKDSIDAYKREWALSTVRNSIKENEKKLQAILDKYQETVTL